MGAFGVTQRVETLRQWQSRYQVTETDGQLILGLPVLVLAAIV